MFREKKSHLRYLISAALALSLAAMLGSSGLADHRDGPIFENIAARLDIGDLYVFRSPANANNTVFMMTVSPFTGGTNGTPNNFQEDAIYDIKIASRFSTQADVSYVTDDITFRVTFSAPDGAGSQDVLLRGLPVGKFGGTGILAKGKINTNVPVTGGGQFRAGVQDDPYFFDEVGFRQFLNGGAFPRPFGTATNRYGPNVNILAITLEIPSNRIAPNNNLLGVWARTEQNGVQQDRAARPFINEGLIPPVPRGSNFPIGAVPALNRQERRNAFNLGHPRDDKANFTTDMLSVLMSFYGRSSADANFLTQNFFLPDILIFQVGNPNGFGTTVGGSNPQFLGNGRRLSDDVMDILLNVITNGAKPTDNVGDDNGLKVTDGSVDPVSGQTRAIAFPYIGAANPAPTGP